MGYFILLNGLKSVPIDIKISVICEKYWCNLCLNKIYFTLYLLQNKAFKLKKR